MSDNRPTFEDYQRPVGGFSGDPLSTRDRYETWLTSEWIADALEDIGVKTRRGVARFFCERVGISVDVDKYSSSALLPAVARQYYRPTMKLLKRYYQEHCAAITLQTTVLHGLPGHLFVDLRTEEARDAMSFSRTKLSEVTRRLRDEGWSEAGFEVVLVREEHAIENQSEDGVWTCYPHFHIIISARRGRGSRDALRRFVGRLHELWTRALRRIKSYLAKPPRLPQEAGQEAVQWLHRLIENRDQLVPMLGFKEYKRRVSAEKVATRTDPVMENASGERYFRVMSPTTEVAPQARVWRERLDLDETLEQWIKPRAQTLYDWATHPDLKYRERLSIDQDVMDAICDELGVEYVSAPGRVIQPLEPSERAPVVDDWHGPQQTCRVLPEGAPPPF